MLLAGFALAGFALASFALLAGAGDDDGVLFRSRCALRLPP
jgi:hypothetical protein